MEITVFAERAAHNLECTKCKYAGSTGNPCPESAKFYSRIKLHESRRETPYVVDRSITFSTGYVQRRRTGHWSLREATAQANVHGGEVIDQTDKYTVA